MHIKKGLGLILFINGADLYIGRYIVLCVIIVFYVLPWCFSSMLKARGCALPFEPLVPSVMVTVCTPYTIETNLFPPQFSARNFCSGPRFLQLRPGSPRFPQEIDKQHKTKHCRTWSA